MKKVFTFTAITFLSFSILGQKKSVEKDSSLLSKETVAGLNFRLVSPASTSGRIADIAIHAVRPLAGRSHQIEAITRRHVRQRVTHKQREVGEWLAWDATINGHVVHSRANRVARHPVRIRFVGGQ